MDFSGVVVPIIESQRFCANIQLSGSVPAGNKWIESIDLVRYTKKNAVVFFIFLNFFVLFVLVGTTGQKKKTGES